MDEMGIFQAMQTARALRRLTPDPVPDDAIAKIIDAGVGRRLVVIFRTGALL
jgi:nitroreductase